MATVKSVLQGKAVETMNETTGVSSGLVFERYFTDGKNSPFDVVEWGKENGPHRKREGRHDFRAGKCGSPKGLVANRDQYGPASIFMASRAQRSARARRDSRSVAW